MTAWFVGHGLEWEWRRTIGAVAANFAAWAQFVLRRSQQCLCGAWGHEVRLALRKDRLLLQCTTCGYESPGWEIGTWANRPRPYLAWRRAPSRHRTRLV
jgi:hypothetical protein